MSYQVIARKYRPQRFEDVVGQEHVTTTLANAIRAGRIAHAYLFCGPRGTGKTTLARIFAKALNATNGPKVDFDDNDPRVKEIAEGRSLDVLEIDGASNNGVEQVRELRDTARFAPAAGKFKIYIIDEVHMLSTAAFNALLKTLEEPPAHVKFIFATTDPEKVLPTILSRCQRFDLRRIPTPLIVEHLGQIARQEKVELD
ncbi:MAG TPA: DNA polymerase III, subunit gamma and tau, partial [Verrucomicrobiales bacterium]|nr:DNA polymerase III, subunit gamma and tau [Verrucomicrobiales bacterium]